MNKFNRLIIEGNFFGDHYDGTVPIDEMKIANEVKWILGSVDSDNVVIKKLKNGGNKIIKKYITIYLNRDGEFHREDGPAFINSGAHSEQWFLNGKRHRLDGPAVTDEFYNFSEYWVKGRQFTKEEFYKHFGDKKDRPVLL